MSISQTDILLFSGLCKIKLCVFFKIMCMQVPGHCRMVMHRKGWHVTADANRETLLHESYFGGNTLVQLLTNQIKIHGGGSISGNETRNWSNYRKINTLNYRMDQHYQMNWHTCWLIWTIKNNNSVLWGEGCADTMIIILTAKTYALVNPSKTATAQRTRRWKVLSEDWMGR